MKSGNLTPATERAHTGERPPFPRRAVVTAGMPYGNKELHFGHVGGVFVHADVYSRFLRDRLGPENVLFVSGTDCYGSAIETSYQEQVESGAFSGTIEDFVQRNHDRQKATLDAYDISLDLYAGSALGDAKPIHRQLSADIFEKLYQEGFLSLLETSQFYDPDLGVFLNGRQVTGRCPIQGCKSEQAYADECSLGHQYNPEELIQPQSTLTGERPLLKKVKNWCLDLQRFAPLLRDRQALLANDPTTRKYLISVIEEFLRPPMIYVKKEQVASVLAERDLFPPFTVQSEPNKASDALVFDSLDDRAAACALLDAREIRYRTGKTLVPFRLSGNITWGVPVPEKEGEKGLTFWVWPESLWAPISFTQTYLQRQGAAAGAYRDWWCAKDARVYQFIGEDNIYFYDVAQTGLFLALQEAKEKSLTPPDGILQLTCVVPNRHVLYQNKKASSSSAQKPPKADELLEVYTKEQLRMHFFHLNLAVNSVSFSPKSWTNPESKGEYDPVLYEGNILTNIYNRLIRSCLYSLQKYFDGSLPGVQPRREAIEQADALILAYENAMYQFEFGKVVDLIDQYLRDVNKYWAAQSKRADQEEDTALRAQVLMDCFHAVRVAATLLHPLAPDGTEKVREYLNVGPALWSWDHIFEPLSFFFDDPENHRMKFLEPRVDFFAKMENQR